MLKIAAVSHFKSQAKLASVLGLAQASVSQWGEVIPEKQALRLEKITLGKLKYDSNLYSKQARGRNENNTAATGA